MRKQVGQNIEFIVLQQAAEWFAVLGADDARDADRERWRRWLADQPSHQLAWQRVEAIGDQFGRLPGTVALTALESGAQSSLQSRRQALKLLGVVGIAAAAATLGVRTQSWKPYLADYSTAIGERRQLTLADGSTLWLNSASSVDVVFDRGIRRIELVRGELLIATAHDPRPMHVTTAHGRMQPLGTRFAVRLDDDDSRLAVFEGAVDVRSADGKCQRVVDSGQQIRFTDTSIDTPTHAERSREAWTRGVLVADNLRLDAFAAELARHRRGHIAVAPEIAHLRLVGAYPLDDIDRIFAMLQKTLPVQVQATLPWWIVIKPRA